MQKEYEVTFSWETHVNVTIIVWVDGDAHKNYIIHTAEELAYQIAGLSVDGYLEVSVKHTADIPQY
jgi:hypothetical protein